YLLCLYIIVTPFVSLSIIPRPPLSTLFPYTTLFRSLLTHRQIVSLIMNGLLKKATIQSNDIGKALNAVRASSKAMPHVKQLAPRSEEHTSELQSRFDLVCRLLLEKKNQNNICQLHQ